MTQEQENPAPVSFDRRRWACAPTCWFQLPGSGTFGGVVARTTAGAHVAESRPRLAELASQPALELTALELHSVALVPAHSRSPEASVTKAARAIHPIPHSHPSLMHPSRTHHPLLAHRLQSAALGAVEQRIGLRPGDRITAEHLFALRTQLLHPGTETTAFLGRQHAGPSVCADGVDLLGHSLPDCTSLRKLGALNGVEPSDLAGVQIELPAPVEQLGRRWLTGHYDPRSHLAAAWLRIGCRQGENGGKATEYQKS